MKSRKSGADLREIVGGRVRSRKSASEDKRRASSRAARHSSATPDWGTPPGLIEPARAVLGAIDLDPASSAKHNARVKAARYYTARDRGETQEWKGRVFCNPPGDRTGELVKTFWRALVRERICNRLEAAIWIGFSLEQLLSLQSGKTGVEIEPFDFPVCIPDSRIKFINGDADRPGHGNYIVFVPPRWTPGAADQGCESFSCERVGHDELWRTDAVNDFERIFSTLGRVVVPR